MTQMTAAARKSMPMSATMPQSLGMFGRLLAGWQKRRQMRRDETWLLSQPDYLLRDIGISRREIDATIRKGRHR
jgi:uncharacterized protein YjiS (DUF1127 family)